jgi:hypothetical protein
MATLPTAGVDLYLNGSWVDITDDVRYRSAIAIDRGRADERSQASPSKCNLTLDNRDGRYSARNPSSPYYGQLGRNTPIRVRANSQPSYLLLYGYGYAGAPDNAALDITGDIDIRVDLEPNSWRPDVEYIIAAKWLTTGNNRSWALSLFSTGVVRLTWSVDGTNPVGVRWAETTVPVPANSGRVTFRATLDVVNGVNKTATFYTGTGGVSGSFTQLGSAVTTVGNTNIFSSAAGLTVGAMDGGNFFTGGTVFSGRVYGLQVRNGIGGTVVANPDFTAQTVDDDAFTDSAGRVWAFANEARIGSDGYRFHGEVSEWPVRWDVSGTDVTVPIQASGIMRRLGAAGDVPSPLRRYVDALPGVLSYFPMEDGSDATTPGSAAVNAPAAVAYDVTFGSESDLPASDGAVTFNSATSSIKAAVLSTANTGFVNLTMLFKLGTTPGTLFELARVNATGTVRVVTISVSSTVFTLDLYGTAGTLLNTHSGAWGGLVDPTQWMALHIALSQTAPGTITWAYYYHQVGSTLIYGPDGTISGTVGRAIGFEIGAAAGKAQAKFAHVVATSQAVPFVGQGLKTAVAAFAGESVIARMDRLCTDAGIPFRTIRPGLVSDTTVTMGAQSRGNTLDLLQEAADADGGILFEPRDHFGLCYRTRTAVENQGRAGNALDLDYTNLAGDLSPTDDDKDVANDVTVKRTQGGSARVVQETGPLNVQDPGTDPDAVGRYAVTIDLPVHDDASLPDIASHRLMIGTWDEARYPVVKVEGRASVVDSTLFAKVLRLDVGDRLTIDGLPAWLPPDQIAQLAQGLREEFSPHRWGFDLNASPAGPYDVGVWDDTDETGVEASRYDTDQSTTSGAITTGTNTSLSVAAAQLWTTTAGDFPFDINLLGARVRVTNITGASSPQTFTISTTVVNGVNKSIASGTPVRLWKPARYGL